MEIDNAFFQELESFRKREVFQNCYGKVLDFCVGTPELSLSGRNLVPY